MGVHIIYCKWKCTKCFTCTLLVLLNPLRSTGTQKKKVWLTQAREEVRYPGPLGILSTAVGKFILLTCAKENY